MQLTKNISVLLVILGVVFFAAGLVQAGGVAEEWVARYNGPGNSYDAALAIAVDSSGDVYVTGDSYGSGTDYDYATIKYDPNGNQKWVARYNGPGNSYDYAYAITLDSSGNVYVTGTSANSGTDPYNLDYATVKYDPNGNQKWVARYNGPGNSNDYASAIAVESSGNIYVTGYITSSSTSYDYATIKYDASGNELWVCIYNGPGNSYDEASAIALDSLGNVYVTGESAGSGTSSDYATIKYDPNGNQKWVARYNGQANGGDCAHAIALDSSDNVYVTGYSFGSGTSSDYATIKYDPNGNQKWVARYNGPGNHGDEAYAIGLDSSGNIYVTGESTNSGTNSEYATIKYDPNGNQKWVARYNGPGNDWDATRAIGLDSSGNVYVTGWSYGSGTYTDYATIKYIQNPVILTMQTEPPEVNSVTPAVGTHSYAQGIMANISAQRFVDCPSVYVFDHWEGDVNDANAASTTVVMDTDKAVTAVFVDGRRCGDECHPYPEGDLNRDCKVNFLDMAVLANNWLACTDPNCD